MCHSCTGNRWEGLTALAGSAPGERRDGDGAEQQALLQAQQRQEFRRVDEELQYNEVLIEERDEAIQEISQQIGEVHEIFQARRRPSPHATCKLEVTQCCTRPTRVRKLLKHWLGWRKLSSCNQVWVE